MSERPHLGQSPSLFQRSYITFEKTQSFSKRNGSCLGMEFLVGVDSGDFLEDWQRD